jgi:hypothetical protein
MTWSYAVGWCFLITFMITFNYHIGDPAVIAAAPPGWVGILFDSVFAALSIPTDTHAAINPYAATSNKERQCNDLHNVFVHAH